MHISPEAAPRASIIVLTRNGMPLLERSLRAVLAQDAPWPFEVLVVDSESTDGSWELAAALGVRRTRVRRADFNHGATRNLAVGLARGIFVVFLVQDAVPANRGWLAALVHAAERPDTAASYSRQVPHADAGDVVGCHDSAAPPATAMAFTQRLAPEQGWETLPPDRRFALSRISNTSSCMPRALLEREPFQPLPYGEDLEWGHRAIRAGLALVYEPASIVVHAHDRSSWYEFKRAYADHALVGDLFAYRVYATPRALAASWATQVASLSRAAWDAPTGLRRRTVLVARALAGATARHLGAWLGAAAVGRAERLPWRAVDPILRRGV